MQLQPEPLIEVAVSPDGRVSVTFTVPLVDWLPTFFTVMVYWAPVCPCVKLPECVLVMVRSGAEVTTLSVAEAVPPAPVWVEVMGKVVLFFVPPVVPVTFAEKVQELPAFRLAPVNMIEPDPAVAVMAPLSQLPLRPFGVETTRPDGRLSVKPMPVRATGFADGLLIVKLRVVLPFS